MEEPQFEADPALMPPASPNPNPGYQRSFKAEAFHKEILPATPPAPATPPIKPPPAPESPSPSPSPSPNPYPEERRTFTAKVSHKEILSDPPPRDWGNELDETELTQGPWTELKNAAILTSQIWQDTQEQLNKEAASNPKQKISNLNDMTLKEAAKRNIIHPKVAPKVLLEKFKEDVDRKANEIGGERTRASLQKLIKAVNDAKQAEQDQQAIVNALKKSAKEQVDAVVNAGKTALDIGNQINKEVSQRLDPKNWQQTKSELKALGKLVVDNGIKIARQELGNQIMQRAEALNALTFDNIPVDTIAKATEKTIGWDPNTLDAQISRAAGYGAGTVGGMLIPGTAPLKVGQAVFKGAMLANNVAKGLKATNTALRVTQAYNKIPPVARNFVGDIVTNAAQGVLQAPDGVELGDWQGQMDARLKQGQEAAFNTVTGASISKALKGFDHLPAPFKQAIGDGAQRFLHNPEGVEPGDLQGQLKARLQNGTDGLFSNAKALADTAELLQQLRENGASQADIRAAIRQFTGTIGGTLGAGKDLLQSHGNLGFGYGKNKHNPSNAKVRIPADHPHTDPQTLPWPKKGNFHELTPVSHPELQGKIFHAPGYKTPGPTQEYDIPYQNPKHMTNAPHSQGKLIEESYLIAENGKQFTQNGTYFTKSNKIASQQQERKWSDAEIAHTIDHPKYVAQSTDQQGGRMQAGKGKGGSEADEVTIYYNAQGDWVARSNATGAIVAISDKTTSQFRDPITQLPKNTMLQLMQSQPGGRP